VPEKGTVVSNIWPEVWELPFEIVSLGSPNRHIQKDELGNLIPSLQQGARRGTLSCTSPRQRSLRWGP
jgi:hypothetical protein